MAEVYKIYCLSDSVGITAHTLARAAVAQYGTDNFAFEVLSNISSFEQLESFFAQVRQQRLAAGEGRSIIALYTFVNPQLAQRFSSWAAAADDIIAIDLITPTLKAIGEVTGLEGSTEPGRVREADGHYFRRVEAVEFAVNHDDGRNPQDLTKADIVLIGVSRTSKTPLSIFLAQEGYRVSNVPLDQQTEPPSEITQVDKTRLFGLMTTPEVLIDIRKRRLGKAQYIASSYADPEYVYQDLEKSHQFMRKLGCKIIHTENRAVEETAQEILRYYEKAHGSAGATWINP